MAKQKTKLDLTGTKLAPKNKLKPVENPVHKLHLNRFKKAEFHRQYFHITPAAKDTVKDTLRPEYWAHVADKLAITDRIEALWEDGTKFTEYKVLDKGPAWAKVVIINNVDLSKAETSDTPEAETAYLVEYGNHQVKYIVTRISDKMRVSQDHPTKEAAEQWLTEHRKST